MMREIVCLLGNCGDAEARRKFADAETVIANLGHDVLNPMLLPDGIDAEQRMSVACSMIDAADKIVLLPAWEKDDQAQQERRYAVEQGKPVERYGCFVSRWIKKLEKES